MSDKKVKDKKKPRICAVFGKLCDAWYSLDLFYNFLKGLLKLFRGDVWILAFVFIFLGLMLFFSDTVYAYLDPGMGTMLLQILAGAALFIGIGWRYIVRFVKNLIKKIKG